MALQPPMERAPGVFRRSSGLWFVGATGSSFLDSGTGQLAFGGSRSDFLSHSGSQTGQITLGGLRSDSLSHSGSGTGQLVLGGLRSDSISHSGSRTGQLTLGGTETSSLSFTDGRSGQLVLAGLRTDSASFINSGSGQIVLGGSAIENYTTAVITPPTDGQLMEKMVFKDLGRYYAPDHGREMFWDTDG